MGTVQSKVLSAEKDDEKALQDFLLDIDCLEELVPWTEKFNIFDVLKISRTEIRHSNVLAWLIDANENHGLGDMFIRGILQKLVEEDDNSKYDVFKILLMDFHSFTIYREWNNIDIMLLSDEEKTIIIFENKVGSHEHSNQLNRYRNIVKHSYPEYECICVFLTPEGELPSDEENWSILTYTDIVEIIEKIRDKAEMPADIDLFVKDYIATIRRDIVDDQQLADICNKIYAKHKKALDLIYEYRVDNKLQMSYVIKNVLREFADEGRIIYNEKNVSSYIRFYTQEMDELIKPLDEAQKERGSWGDCHLYSFWLSYSENTLWACFELGGVNVPEEQMTTMQKIIDLEKPNDKRRLNFKYKHIYSKKYKIEENGDVSQSARAQITMAANDLLRWESRLLDKLESKSNT